MRAILIPLALLALALPSAAAQEVERTDQPERMLATELPTRDEALGEIEQLLDEIAASEREIDEISAIMFSDPRYELLRQIRTDGRAYAMDVRFRMLLAIDSENADLFGPVFEAGFADAATLDSLGFASSSAAFARAAAAAGYVDQARDLLDRVRALGEAQPEDPREYAHVPLWAATGLGYASIGDADAAARAMMRGFDINDSSAMALSMRMNWTRALAEAGSREHAFGLLQFILAHDQFVRSETIESFGPVVFLEILERIGGPGTRSVILDILDTHYQGSVRSQASLSTAVAALDAGRPESARFYTRLALRDLLANAPPYEDLALLNRARVLAASAGDCETANGVSELLRLAGEIGRLRNDGIGNRSYLVIENTRPNEFVLMECGSPRAAVQAVINRAELHGQALPDGQPMWNALEFGRLAEEASSDEVRRSLSVALAAIIPADQVLRATASDLSMPRYRVSFVLAWVEGALASGRRRDAEAALLALYNDLSTDPEPRLMALSWMLPALPAD